jgi:hypothetical protein
MTSPHHVDLPAHVQQYFTTTLHFLPTFEAKHGVDHPLSICLLGRLVSEQAGMSEFNTLDDSSNFMS